ncbi:hypothetical protein Ahy_B07g086805 [Arachis hypogaea]|uniref:F-box domain-containing protein n=1 Tax=Arachis hypogaea TaxID=3818 RepID=A0A444YAL3_ARAHY|nr:hypothetical protein Ahy_B07g086805 [Arachis hypogaea]
MKDQHPLGSSRTSTAQIDDVFDGGHCRDETNSNLSMLPTDMILKIFLLSDGKTIGRGRCISRDWYNRLNRVYNTVTHLKSEGGKAAVLHLDNPLKEVDCGQLSLYVFDTRVDVPVAAPLDWTWFSLVGSAMGKLCARFSTDGRSSSPLGSLRSIIPDLGFDSYHFNHRDDWSTYAFVAVIGSDDYKILSLTKRHLATAGYDKQIFLSNAGAMEWGRHLFVGDPNLTNTSCVMFGLDLLGISHFIRGFDVFDPSLDAVVLEVQFHYVGLTDGVVRFVGRVRWAGIVSIKGCMEFSLSV